MKITRLFHPPHHHGSMLCRLLPYISALLLALSAPASARIKLLVPQPDEFVRISDFFVIMSVPSEDEGVQKIRLFFDKEDVTALSRHTAATISFIPDAPFLVRPGLVGAHMFTAILYGAYGRRIEEFSSRIYLVKEDNLTDAERTAMIESGKKLVPFKPLEPYGNGRVNLWYEYETFQNKGKPVAEADAWGNGGLGDVSYDYNVTLRSDENSHYQSLQRFRVAAGYRNSARLSVGDNWPSYHQSILTRQRVRGLELNLKTPGKKAGIDVIWGQALKKVEPFIINQSALAACTTYNDSVTAFAAGTYNRTLMASRLFYTASSRFSLSATVLKATDAVTSISQLTRIDAISRDTTVTGATPMDNLAFGAEGQMRLFKEKMQLFGSYAMSFLTRDISDGAITKSDLDRIFGGSVQVPNPDNIDWLLIFNQSTVPLPIPADTGQRINGKSLGGASNWNAGVRLRLPIAGVRNNAEVKYFYAGPHYASLGNPLLQVNRAGWLLNLETNLFDSKLLIKGNAAIYDKDLFEITGTPTRAFQTTLTGFLSLRSNFPTLMLIGSLNDERARTDDAADFRRKNTFATIGSALQYSPGGAAAFRPSLNISYYNSQTEITTSALAQPFGMRTHTAIFSFNSIAENMPLEPCLTASLNHTTGDIPLTIGSVTAGTRWHIVRNFVLTDLLFCYANTKDREIGKRNEYSFKTNWRFEITKRQSFWADAAIKLTVKDCWDKRIKVNYEVRY